MTEENNYLEDRLEGQRKWHSDKASLNKNRYQLVEMITIIAGATIPVINVIDFEFINEPSIRILSALIGAIIVVAAGLSKLFKFQENWINYRTLSETLKREQEFYRYEVGDYDARSDQKRLKLLVQRVENILASATEQYMAVHKASQEQAMQSTEEIVE